MFVGVVVNNFQKVQRLAETKEELDKKRKKLQKVQSTTSQQRRLLKQQAIDHYQVTESGEIIPIPESEKESKCRIFIRKISTSDGFEVFMVAATTLNVLLMSIEFWNMPEILVEIIHQCNHVFLGLLTFELILKTIGLGFKGYFSDGWNRFDLTILTISYSTILLEIIFSMPFNSPVIRIIRIVRIVRIIRLWKATHGVQSLIKALSLAIPQCSHLSVIFILLFFIYASLGVHMYGNYDCFEATCEGLSRHANFKSFGSAMLLLFRVFTGDNWNVILKDILHQSSQRPCPENGLDCTFTHMISPFYFVSFVLLAQFVLINVVVAVLMVSIVT